MDDEVERLKSYKASLFVPPLEPVPAPIVGPVPQPQQPLALQAPDEEPADCVYYRMPVSD